VAAPEEEDELLADGVWAGADRLLPELELWELVVCVWVAWEVAV